MLQAWLQITSNTTAYNDEAIMPKLSMILMKKLHFSIPYSSYAWSWLFDNPRKLNFAMWDYASIKSSFTTF